MLGRLSRPSLAQQYPLPRETNKISPLASLAFPSKSSDQDFILGANVSKNDWSQLNHIADPSSSLYHQHLALHMSARHSLAHYAQTTNCLKAQAHELSILSG